MRYNNFEEVPVWKDSIELAKLIFDTSMDDSLRFKGDIANQIQRAGLSVSNNIAEGFERGTTAELITFLYYSKGSAGEVRSVTYVMDKLSCFDHLQKKIAAIRALATSVSRQLNGWLASLKETDIAGPRHLSEKERQAYKQKKKASAFIAENKREVDTRLNKLLEERAKQRGSEISDFKSQIDESK
jgi:four helix bundle protein